MRLALAARLLLLAATGGSLPSATSSASSAAFVAHPSRRINAKGRSTASSSPLYGLLPERERPDNAHKEEHPWRNDIALPVYGPPDTFGAASDRDFEEEEVDADRDWDNEYYAEEEEDAQSAAFVSSSATPPFASAAGGATVPPPPYSNAPPPPPPQFGEATAAGKAEVTETSSSSGAFGVLPPRERPDTAHAEEHPWRDDIALPVYGGAPRLDAWSSEPSAGQGDFEYGAEEEGGIARDWENEYYREEPEEADARAAAQFGSPAGTSGGATAPQVPPPFMNLPPPLEDVTDAKDDEAVAALENPSAPFASALPPPPRKYTPASTSKSISSAEEEKQGGGPLPPKERPAHLRPDVDKKGGWVEERARKEMAMQQQLQQQGGSAEASSSTFTPPPFASPPSAKLEAENLKDKSRQGAASSSFHPPFMPSSPKMEDETQQGAAPSSFAPPPPNMGADALEDGTRQGATPSSFAAPSLFSPPLPSDGGEEAAMTAAVLPPPPQMPQPRRSKLEARRASQDHWRPTKWQEEEQAAAAEEFAQEDAPPAARGLPTTVTMGDAKRADQKAFTTPPPPKIMAERMSRPAAAEESTGRMRPAQPRRAPFFAERTTGEDIPTKVTMGDAKRADSKAFTMTDKRRQGGEGLLPPKESIANLDDDGPRSSMEMPVIGPPDLLNAAKEEGAGGYEEAEETRRPFFAERSTGQDVPTKVVMGDAKRADGRAFAMTDKRRRRGEGLLPPKEPIQGLDDDGPISSVKMPVIGPPDELLETHEPKEKPRRKLFTSGASEEPPTKVIMGDAKRADSGVFSKPPPFRSPAKKASEEPQQRPREKRLFASDAGRGLPTMVTMGDAKRADPRAFTTRPPPRMVVRQRQNQRVGQKGALLPPKERVEGLDDDGPRSGVAMPVIGPPDILSEEEEEVYEEGYEEGDWDAGYYDEAGYGEVAVAEAEAVSAKEEPEAVSFSPSPLSMQPTVPPSGPAAAMAAEKDIAMPPPQSLERMPGASGEEDNALKAVADAVRPYRARIQELETEVKELREELEDSKSSLPGGGGDDKAELADSVRTYREFIADQAVAFQKEKREAVREAEEKMRSTYEARIAELLSSPEEP